MLFKTYLLADKASVGRLARWSLKLQEFDMVVKYQKGSTLGATNFMSRIREDPSGGYAVGPIQPGMAEGEEPPGVTKARVTVTLKDEHVEVGDGFLKSRHFEIAQPICPWVSALLTYVKSEGTILPEAVRIA